MARRRFKPHINKNSTFGLNITSMTDMFTILLVFLLQTYSTSVEIVNPESGIRLPSSTSDKESVKGLKLTLRKDSLLIDGQEVVKLNDKGFLASDIDPQDPSFIQPLFKELDRRAKEMAPDDKLQGKIFMQAERSLPYDVLRKVMYTASMAGYPQLKMATIVGE